MPLVKPQPHQTDAAFPSWARGLLVLMLLLAGVAMMRVGLHAVSQHHLALVKSFDGATAVRLGSGLMSFGVMLAVWGIALIAIVVGGSRLCRVLTWISFAGLLATVICIYAPWDKRSLPFWTVAVLVNVYFFTAPESHHESLGRLFFPLLIAAMALTAGRDLDLGASMGVGLFAAVGILAHVLVLFPRLKKRILSDRSDASDPSDSVRLNP